MKRLLGFQIGEGEGETSVGGVPRAEGFEKTDVLPLTFCLRWIRKQECPQAFVLWPIFEDDIEKPTFPHGKSSLKIEV